VPIKVSVPLSIIVSVLIFGLSRYYSFNSYQVKEEAYAIRGKREFGLQTSDVLFISLFSLALVTISIPTSETNQDFIPWEQFGLIQIIKLAAATALNFFLPGYAIVKMLDKKNSLTNLEKALIGYLFSVLLTGIIGIVYGSLGYSISDHIIFVIAIYLIILFLFTIRYARASEISAVIKSRSYLEFINELWRMRLSVVAIIKNTDYSSQCIVFACLFALVILYTYYLYNGVIVGDQWFHLGRSFLFSSGNFNDLVPYDSATLYPPFFSSLLAVFFSLSDSPSVNAYVSISFLNITPVIAFYYLFKCWIPRERGRAALLSSTLFVLSSGFGWLHVLDTVVTDPTITKLSALESLQDAGLRTSDVRSPTTFVYAGHPDFSTPLIIIAVPAGFVLTGLIKKRDISTKLEYIILIAGISILGILSHDEFYLFVIIAAVVLIFRSKSGTNKNSSYVALLSALGIVTLIDLALLSGKYYIVREIAGVPIIGLCFLLILSSWALSNIGMIANRTNIKLITKVLNSIRGYNIASIHGRLFLGIIVVSLVSYFYLFTFIVWGYIPLDDVRAHTGNFGQPDVPWYLYPMKFGLTGLLGVAFLLSYLFKKFEKEIFVFALIAILALLAGPYYDEHRFGKYIMASMAAFAALLLYKIMRCFSWPFKFKLIKSKLKLRQLLTSLLLGSVITGSGLSIFMFAGYNALAIENPQFGIALTKRDFPFPSEMQMLEYLRGKFSNSKTFNIAVPEKEVDINRGLITKIEGFSSVPRAKLLQSPLTLNSSTLEGFYNLLEHTDTRYIVLPKKDFVNLGNSERKTSALSSSNNNLILQFALENFPRPYEDRNYIVLEVPPLTSPSSSSSVERNGDVALIYPRDSEESFLTPLISNSTNNTNQITILPSDLQADADNLSSHAVNYKEYNNEGNEIYSSSYEPKLDEKKGTSQKMASIILDDRHNSIRNKSSIEEERMTLWSAPLDRKALQKDNNIIHLDASFRVVDNTYDITNNSNNGLDRKEIKQQHHDYNAGIVFEYGKNNYEISMRKNGLELLLKQEEQSNTTTQFCNQSAEKGYNKQGERSSSTSLLSQNQEIKRETGIWYHINLVISHNIINVYLNDILSALVQVPQITEGHSSASRLPSYNNHTIQDICFSDSIYPSLSKVGIKAFHSLAEFGPITIGTIPESESEHVKQKVYKNHYYPLSMLALSGINKYDTFMEGDSSAFSSQFVILPLSSDSYSYDEYNNSGNGEDWYYHQDVETYLKFVREGGTLVIMHTNNDDNNLIIGTDNIQASKRHGNYFEGTLSKVFGVKLGNLTEFDSIARIPLHPSKPVTNYITNVSGEAREIISVNSTATGDNGITVGSYYMNSNRADSGNDRKNNNPNKTDDVKVPFSLEKKYGKGKIIFVNGGGYFDAISNQKLPAYLSTKPHYNNEKYFTTLTNITRLIGLEQQLEEGQGNNSEKPTVVPLPKIIGDLKVSMHPNTSVVINSSSMIIPSLKEGFPESNSNDYNLLVKDIIIMPRLSPSPIVASNNEKLLPSSILGGDNKANSNSTQNKILKNLPVKDLELYGNYEVTINSTGGSPLYLPGFSSYYDYVAMSISSGFDMTVNLYGNNSYIQLTANLDEDKADNVSRFDTDKANNYNSSDNNNSYLLQKQQLDSPIRISNNGSNKNGVTQVQLHQVQVKAESTDIKAIPILVKSPEIKILNTEDASFRTDSHRNSLTEIEGTEGEPVDVVAKFDFTDHYHQGYRDGIRTQFVTYLKEGISSGEGEDKKSFEIIKIPGDISESAKEKGMDNIPWRKALSSSINMSIAFGIGSTGIVVFLWKVHSRRK